MNIANNVKTSRFYQEMIKAAEDVEKGEKTENSARGGVKPTSIEEDSFVSSTEETTFVDYDAQISDKTREVEDKKSVLDKTQKEYDEIQEKIEEKEDEIEKKNKEIEEKQKEIDTKKRQLKRYENATDEIGRKKYKTIAKDLQGLYDELSGLYSNLTNLNSELTTLKIDLENKSSDLKLAQSDYDNATTELSELEKSKPVTETEEASAVELTESASETSSSSSISTDIKDYISEAELQLVKDYNLNLSAKLPDGSPRYIIAKANANSSYSDAYAQINNNVTDNNYHIYDMTSNLNPLYGDAYMAIARLYGANYGFYEAEMGTDIVPEGSGYLETPEQIKNMHLCATGFETNATFYVNDCGKVEQGCCMTYVTDSPLSLDLDGDGINTSDKVIDYDIDGDGTIDKINDSDDAVLVFDKDKDGVSGSDGSECFGDNTDLDGDGVKDGFKNGFDALKALAKENGLIDGKEDNVLDENDLNFLQDEYGLQLKTQGYNSEGKSLTELGITEINLANTDETTMEKDFDGRGNDIMRQEGATFKINGETREYADIWHRKLDEKVENTDKTFNSSSLSFNIKKLMSFANMRKNVETNKIKSVKEDKKEIEEQLKKQENIFEKKNKEEDK